MPAVMALDQGTTSSRTLIFDAGGRQLALAQQEFAQHYPRPGWVEHDAAAIWETQLATARQALRQAGLQAGDIAGIGITNQRETTVLWDRASGEPVAPAIVWQDRRTADLCAALRGAGYDRLIRARTGLETDAYFSATKLAWLLANTAGLRARAAAGELAFGTIDSWLIWKLTGGARHVTDASNASRTMLYDIHRGAWDAELLANFEIPPDLMPEVVDASGVVGETTLLGGAIPIAGIAGDQQAALYGQGCHRAGEAKCTYGTGCFLLLNTGATAARSANRLLTTVAWQRQGRRTYALEGSVFAGGATVQWLRDGLGIIDSAAAVEALAASVPDSADTWLVPAFAGLGAPWWDGHARGALLGLTRGTTRAHIARAALESIALQVCDLATAMDADAAAPLTALRVDGGACANDLLMQMQADFLGLPVIRPRNTESTALGAARLAGEAVGVWTPGADLPAATTAERVFEPAMAADLRAAKRARWRQAVARALDWAEADGA